ncbi:MULTISPECIES: enhanced serine sensitivity protein SseB [Clostridium]|uniref:enhanced serine sensitivity protein SseB n=1 Tax=Clostridium TaxID=1485 RepID=UPI000825C417|nr:MULTISPECIES: enhanced serine sensitivity protein SseB [Clostridium]PJI07554.1 enhanced serine sensitivity protein SseB [Clostridium sp. CT7]
MNDERKDEIGNLFLLKKETSVEELKKLEIQEIIFLIYSSKYYRDKKAFINDNFDEKIKIFFSVLNERIKDAEELYIAYDKNTNYPYIDDNDRVWLFSKEEYAERAKDYFMQQLIMLEMKKITSDEIIKEFANLHRTGIKKILVDNGEYNTEIDRDNILPPTDWSNTPDINIPVTNPKLQHGMIRFFQMLYSKNNYKGKEQVLHSLEDKMLDEVLNAKYLVPMKLQEKEPSVPDEAENRTIKEGAIMRFANLVGDDNANWLPAFTDWTEFEKVYDKNSWSGNIAFYDDLLALSEKIEGIVINCNGIPLRINENNKKMIEEYKQELNEPKAASVKKSTVKKDTKVMLGEPKDYPHEMIQAVKEYMKKQKSIKKAYLRLMIKDNEKSYLMIVDFNGEKEDIFNGISEIAGPYLNGMFLDMVGMDDWAKDAIKDVNPFYKRKLFGIL